MFSWHRLGFAENPNMFGKDFLWCSNRSIFSKPINSQLLQEHFLLPFHSTNANPQSWVGNQCAGTIREKAVPQHWLWNTFLQGVNAFHIPSILGRFELCFNLVFIWLCMSVLFSDWSSNVYEELILLLLICNVVFLFFFNTWFWPNLNENPSCTQPSTKIYKIY